MSRSPFQRFVHELRRRHVPQTAAIYLVAAWAAIEFADVVVPNLNGPQWAVTAVIVAALVGFPVMLVVAWIFEWGPGGIHRTEDAAAQRMEAPPAYDEEAGGVEPAPATTAAPPDRSQPWLAALAVLVVAIGGALAAAYVLQGGGPRDAAAPPADSAAGEATDRIRGEAGEGPSEGAGLSLPDRPEIEAYGPGLGDSISAQVSRAFGALDSVDLSELAELGRRAATRAGVSVVVSEPQEWRGGPAGPSPVPLAEDATLDVEGVAFDTTGVVAVIVDGETVAAADEPQETLPFRVSLPGRGNVGTRSVAIVVRTADGREVRNEFQVIQLPGGTP